MSYLTWKDVKAFRRLCAGLMLLEAISNSLFPVLHRKNVYTHLLVEFMRLNKVMEFTHAWLN